MKNHNAQNSEMQTEALKIIERCNERDEKIMQEAIANGTWLPGLDSNRHLFKESHAEMLREFAEFRKKYGIDED